MIDTSAQELQSLNPVEINDEEELYSGSSDEKCVVIFHAEHFIKYNQLLEIGDQHAMALFVAALVVAETSLLEASILTCVFNLLLLIGRYLIIEECNKIRMKQKLVFNRENHVKSLIHIDLFSGFRAWLRNFVIIGMILVGGRLIMLMFVMNIDKSDKRETFNNIFTVNLISFLASIFGVYIYLQSRSSVSIPSDIEKYLLGKRPSELELGCTLLNHKHGPTLEQELKQFNIIIQWMNVNGIIIKSPHSKSLQHHQQQHQHQHQHQHISTY
ncbi:hypothetical protein DLAC_11114 [Tieghemostelium lacteum]|uniref:Transmembrane protein n=1 Tax=Tieghemostelium lacteum TaxID=361077 RepID=A0A151Z376_TIELA|nr:hypothetical protein DLAC_11114 [Tieghemostelium lacteum]|eukprot:KYQ88413.1 hypothetical protein DLAC_11114 [Tieghemostelium lacteum]